MRNIKSRKIINIAVFISGLILIWGGLFYAVNGSEGIKFPGIVAAVIGYILFSWVIYEYENDPEDRN